MLFVLRSGSRFFIGVMNPFQAFGPMAVWVATVKNEAENTAVSLLLLFDIFFVKLIEPLGIQGGGVLCTPLGPISFLFMRFSG